MTWLQLWPLQNYFFVEKNNDLVTTLTTAKLLLCWENNATPQVLQYLSFFDKFLHLISVPDWGVTSTRRFETLLFLNIIAVHLKVKEIPFYIKLNAENKIFVMYNNKDCLQWHHEKFSNWVVISSEKNWRVELDVSTSTLWSSSGDDQSILIETLSCNLQFISELLITTQFENFTWCHCKQSLLILFTMQSYKSYYMVSPQTVFTYPFHHAKLQILLMHYNRNNINRVLITWILARDKVHKQTKSGFLIYLNSSVWSSFLNLDYEVDKWIYKGRLFHCQGFGTEI